MLIITMVNGIFRILEVAILIDCLISWVPDLRYSKFAEIIHSITNPVLEPCRQLQYKLGLDLPVDFSPIIALLVMDVIRTLLVWII